MIVIAILGLLATIAFPGYRDYVLRVRRTEATRALIDVAQKMENYFVSNKTYTNNLIALGFNADPFITEDDNYSLEVRDNGGGGGACPIAVCFELEATPIDQQADDTDCALFRLNSDLVKTAFADDNSQNNSCW